jgi:polysaccharide export outer membrane protein
MKSNPALYLVTIAAILILSSCVTKKKLTYLQYSANTVDSGMPIRDPRVAVTPSAYKLMPYDVLFIRVITPDPQWSQIFNASSAGAGVVTAESANLTGYPIDIDGNIEIPFVGKVEVEGKTVSETKHKLDTVFRNYLTDASITVRLVDSYINIIGEVGEPGRYPITKDRLNVFEALSMAGDMNTYSDRQKVQLIRPSKYGPVVREFSLRDRSILTSEFFYMMPNDVIYAPPLKGRSVQANSSVYALVLSSFATILTSITTLIVIFDYSSR